MLFVPPAPVCTLVCAFVCMRMCAHVFVLGAASPPSSPCTSTPPRSAPAACPSIEVKSEAVSRRSCYDHYVSGARLDGVYRINRGGGTFSLYCDMTTAGGGWDLVSNVVQDYLNFGVQRCTSLISTCYGGLGRGMGVFCVRSTGAQCVSGVVFSRAAVRDP
jgi:hypothetical protein